MYGFYVANDLTEHTHTHTSSSSSTDVRAYIGVSSYWIDMLLSAVGASYWPPACGAFVGLSLVVRGTVARRTFFGKKRFVAMQ